MNTVKVVVVGDSGVGKTSVIMRYVNDDVSTVHATYGVDCFTVDILGETVTIWDTAGQDRFKCITPMFYRGSHIVIIMYDITNRESFTSVTSWIDSTKKAVDEECTMCLVGNKTDLSTKRVIERVEGIECSRSNCSMLFFETSAKTSAASVRTLFTSLLSTFIQKNKKEESTPPQILHDMFKVSDVDITHSSCCRSVSI